MGLTGCATAVEQPSAPEKILKAPTTRETLQDTAFFQSISLVPLETAESSLIRSINRICLADDTLFVFDRSLAQVTIFDREGHYINTIHNIGGGPQEYSQIQDIGIHSLRRKLVLFCSPNKVLYYTYAGKQIEAFTYADQVADGEFAIQGDSTFFQSAYALGERAFGIFSYPMKLEKQLDVGTGLYADTESKGVVHGFSRGRRMTANNGQVSFTWPFDYSIYGVRNGKIYTKYWIDFQDKKIPESLLHQQLDGFEFLDICREKEYIFTIENVVENEKYLVFDYARGLGIYDKWTDQLKLYSYIEQVGLGRGGSSGYLSCIIRIIPTQLSSLMRCSKISLYFL
jgi:hypothetical protein